MEEPPTGPSSSSSSSSFPHPRRTLTPEDTVFYAIYPDDPSTPLDPLRLLLLSSLSPFLRDYIWQHEPFQLSLPPPPPSPSSLCPLCLSPSPPHLHGKTRFGDNLEDEWFIVSLLLHFSRSFPSLSARVWDSDGDFLLIESAFSLPRWLSPLTSPHRVFLRRGDLHLLGPRSIPLSPAPPPLPDALRALLTPTRAPTRAPDAAQAAIRRRIRGYPHRAVELLMHRARVRLPLPAARVLREEPCLVSLAVEGFYDRDVDTMRQASRMERFLMGEGGEGAVEMVAVGARMSRAMYAQLVQQRFQAPRCYPMPQRDDGPAAFAEAELGMKIACGLEMMYQERRRAGEEGKGATWEAFKESLECSRYFRDLLPGSLEHKRLMREAEEGFRSSILFSHASNVLNAPVRRIDEILASPYLESDFKGIDVPPSDDDSWMYNGEDELNVALAERQKEMEQYESEHRRSTGKQKTLDTNSGVPLDENNIGEMAKTLRVFVEKASSFEGAEVPENRDSKEVEFDVDRFIECFKLDGETSMGQQGASDIDLEDHSSFSDMDPDEYEDSEDESHTDKDSIQDTYMQCYSNALNEELKMTTLKKSFIRTQAISSSGKETYTTAEDMYEDLSTVDVDGNLVMSLLDSYKSQQGLPGPASNLLGSLGLKLPNSKTKVKK